MPPRPALAARTLVRALAPFLAVLTAVVAVAVLGYGLPVAAHGRRHWPLPQVLHAIRQVESGGRDDVADGDQGQAIGPYQIHREYWQDALRLQPGIGGDYQDCRRRAYAEQVVTAYMQHYAAPAWANGDAEVIARVHNGGPRGAQLDATLGYWARVRRHLPD